MLLDTVRAPISANILSYYSIAASSIHDKFLEGIPANRPRRVLDLCRYELESGLPDSGIGLLTINGPREGKNHESNRHQLSSESD